MYLEWQQVLFLSTKIDFKGIVSVNFSKKNYCAEGEQLQNYTMRYLIF
jgi:hypothetical protein